jgi:hypothetical protein
MDKHGRRNGDNWILPKLWRPLTILSGSTSLFISPVVGCLGLGPLHPRPSVWISLASSLLSARGGRRPSRGEGGQGVRGAFPSVVRAILLPAGQAIHRTLAAQFFLRQKINITINSPLNQVRGSRHGPGRRGKQRHRMESIRTSLRQESPFPSGPGRGLATKQVLSD